MQPQQSPQVLIDPNGRPLILYARGRKKFHAVAANGKIRLVALDSLRGLRPLQRNGAPYPARRAASYWLNHDHREITARAKLVLRSLVARRTNGTNG
jgi:hypothetical protein